MTIMFKYNFSHLAATIMNYYSLLEFMVYRHRLTDFPYTAPIYINIPPKMGFVIVKRAEQ